MLYQKLIVGRDPYFVNAEKATAFTEHRHPELELSFCLSGSYGVIVNKKYCRVKSGCLVLIAPMTPHEFPEDEEGKRLTAEVGAGFLGGYFDPFKSFRPVPLAIDLNDESDPVKRELYSLLSEVSDAAERRPAFSALVIKSCLYRISALLLSYLTGNGSATISEKIISGTAKTEKALDLIYENYNEKLDLDRVCKACGCAKSSFCRDFKRLTGDTFHNVLNAHRVEMACLALSDPSVTVEETALSVGFPDSKSFCRVFKKIKGVSTGEWRSLKQ